MKKRNVTYEDALKAFKSAGTKKGAAELLGIPKSTLFDILSRGDGEKKTSRIIGKKGTFDDAVKEFDRDYVVKQAIEKAIKSVGEEYWVYEPEMIRRAKITVSNMNIYRDQFSEYWLDVRDKKGGKKRVWAGSVELARRLRDLVV